MASNFQAASPTSPGPSSARPHLRHLSSSDSGYHSPQRHHHRLSSTHRVVRETSNAHSEYSNSEDDGTSQLRINQYLIGQEIGRGSFGAVHLATDQYDQEYAVKEFSKTRLRRRAQSNLLRRPHTNKPSPRSTNLANAPFGLNAVLTKPPPLHPPKAADPENPFDLIREEIAVMKKLNHPNLVSLIEVLDDPQDDSLFMVLEMCKKGVVMKVEVEEDVEPYDEDSCRTWFRDLMLGIEYLHAQGVIHRDIKPDNCLLTEDDTLKIVDFGVSEMFQKQDEMRVAKSAGSPAFQAPELCILKHGDVYGKPADIWSMGVTLYCLRFGRVPFRKASVLDMYDAIVNEELELPDDMDPSFNDLMRRILEKDPLKRITMQELRAHPWVTKDGTEELMSIEENCSEMVEPPTASEMNAAITHNMGRVLAVMKAAKRFKSLVHKDHPDLVNSILGSASKFVRAPSTMSRSESSSAAEPIRQQSISEDDIMAARTALDKEGDTVSARLVSQLSKLPERVRTAVVSSEDTTPELPDSPTILRKIKTEPLPEGHLKGHAHDPLEDEIFLNIGAGPNHTDGAIDDATAPAAVCESPSATGFNVYETAYRQEVEKIYMKQGKQATIYLTRRIEHKAKEKWKDFSADASKKHASSGNTSDKLKYGLVGLVDKAVETANDPDKRRSPEHASEVLTSGLSGLVNNVVEATSDNSRPRPSKKSGFAGLVSKAVDTAKDMKEPNR